MEYIFQIPILVLMLWAAGASYTEHNVVLSDGRIEAFLINAYAGGSAYGAIDLNSCRFAL